MQRKHIPMEKMEEEIEDIAGIRIICQFEEDIDTVASIIRSRSDMTIKSEKLSETYQAERLPSYHLIIYYTRYDQWAKTPSGRNSDSYNGYELLGYDRTFSAV